MATAVAPQQDWYRRGGYDAISFNGNADGVCTVPYLRNPFNPSTEIRFDLPEAVHVRLVVYDVIGREAARLVDEALPAGQHRATWDATGLPNGTYFYRLTAGSVPSPRRRH